MNCYIKSDRIVTPSGIFDGYIESCEGYISGLTKKAEKDITIYDFTGKYVFPGFVELHTHGAGGYPFLTESAEVVAKACDYHLAHGTTTILPTLSASPIKVMKEGVKAIREARDGQMTAANIVGAHLEGPYLSPKQCGAQCTDHITPPSPDDYKALIAEYGDAIARWTYAPERDDGSFAAYLNECGIIASAGHTDATYKDMARAEENGCNLVTHLYSCTSTVTRNMGFRSLGVIESTFLSDNIYAEIIADGKHLPKELVKMIIKIKGTDRVIAVTDSLEIAGTDIKSGNMAGTDFIVEDGVCKLSDRSAFAGSVATSDVLLRFLTSECDVSLSDAAKMLCENPARLLNINAGKIAEGCRSDLVILDEALNVEKVLIFGREFAK